MKIKFSILFSVIALLAFDVSAQFSPLPAFGDMLTNYNTLANYTNGAALGGFTNQLNLDPAGYTNFTTGNGLTNIGTRAVSLPPGSGFAFFPCWRQTNGILSGSNITFNFNLTYDGTNWTTSNPLKFTSVDSTNNLAIAGITNFPGWRDYTNFSPLVLNNARAIRLDSIVHSHSNHIYLSNSTYSVYR